MASLISRLGRVFPPIARYILAAVFLFSAMGKLVSPAQFHAFVASFLPTIDTTVLLYAVVLAEIALAFLLVYPRTSVVGGVCSVGALLAFTLLLIVQSHAGSEVPCGCFGEFIAPLSHDASILRNFVLLLLAALTLHRITDEEKVGAK
jgi:hypothetical protein